MNKLQAMQAFVAVVDARSFVEAARRLEVSTTAVSRLVAQLEDSFGIRLLQRTTRRVDLTDAGTLYYQQCCKIIEEIRRTEDSMLATTSKPSGTLRLHAPSIFGCNRIHDLLPRYQALHPAVSIELTVSSRSSETLEDRYDVAIHIGFPPSETRVARKLASLRLIVCAAPKYIERHGMPRTPADLVRHNCMTSTYADQVDRWTFANAAGDITEVDLHGDLRTNDAVVLRHTAIAGQGITRLPEYMLTDDLRSGALVALLTEWETPGMGIYAIYPSHRYLSPTVRSFVDFMAAEWIKSAAGDSATRKSTAATNNGRVRAAGARVRNSRDTRL